MLATVVTVKSPFSRERDIRHVKRRCQIKTLAPKTELPFICLYNGDPLLRGEWERKVGDGDIVAFVTLPQGGRGGSNPISIVMSIALSVMAPQMGFMMASEWVGAGGALGSFMSTEALGSFIGGAIGFICKGLISALIPSPKPAAAQMAQSYTVSPTYSLGAQGNMARIGSPIPSLYGRHMIYPDYAAEPYTQYTANEQYLYQLFVIGQGYYDIESIRIEDTPIANFAEVEYEVIQPGGTVTLFPSDVINCAEVSGQELVYGVSVGPFIVNPPGTLCNAIGIDSVLPKGLFSANDIGGLNAMDMGLWYEACQIDDTDAEIGGWFSLATISIRAATATPIRDSQKTSVPPGRYKVRGIRSTIFDNKARSGNDATWAGARAYLQTSHTYGDITLVAIKMRASNNVSALSSRKINLTVTRKLPVWNGSSWSAVTSTRNPAWAFADICKAEYGGGQADAQVDLETLRTLQSVWESRGDYFDGVFDNTISIWDALTQVARAGRAKPFIQGGIVRLARDSEATLPVALFTMRNIARNSLKVDYLIPNDETADMVRITYLDSTIWKQKTVDCQLSGYTSAKPADIQMFGIVGRDHAWREGMYTAAANRYRRQMVTFQTEMEGFIPVFGDLIAITHDRTNWGTSGTVRAYDAGTKVLTVSEPLTFGVGDNYFGFKKRDGSFDGPWLATAGVDEYHAVLDSALDFTPDTDYARENTTFCFGLGETYTKKAKVVSVKARSMNTAEIVAVVDDAAVYTADSGSAPAESIYWNLPALITRPLVTGIQARFGGTVTAPIVLVSWDAAAGATSYAVEASFDGELTWQRMADTAAVGCNFPARQLTAISIRVAGIGTAQGDWVGWTGSLVSYPPSDVTNFTVAADPLGITLAYDANAEVDFLDYELRLGSSWVSSNLVNHLTDNFARVQPLSAGSYTWRIKARDQLRIFSENEATVSLTVTVPDAPSVSVAVTTTDYVLSWPAPASMFAIDDYEIRTGSISGPVIGTTKATTFQNPIMFSGSVDFFVTARDIAGNTSTASNATLTIIAPSAPTVTAQVIDNNVLLFWSDAKQTLPIATYEIRCGATFAGATVIGTKSGQFTSLFETVAGLFTYWVVGIDTAGNPGTPTLVAATVRQPPDYVLKASYDSTFSGTLNNAVMDEGVVILPINTAETFEDHFVNHSWATPQYQIDAGYPIYIEPSLSGGYYEETIDYGTALASTRITVSLVTTVMDGMPVVTLTISVKLNSGDAWTDYAGVSEVYATNFRYIKVKIEVASSGGDDLLHIDALNTKLDVKLTSDGGTATCNASDAGGTVVNFNVPFIDVDAITTTALSTTPVTANYDFVDMPNPTSFKILLFNSAGTRVSGPASWGAKGSI